MQTSTSTQPKMIGQIKPGPRNASGFARKKPARTVPWEKVCSAVDAWKIRRGIWE
jgi:hypothetical protein